MKLLLCGSLLLTATLPAVSRAQANAAVYGLDVPFSANACPVGFAARRTGALRGLLADQQYLPHAGAGFHLILKPQAASAIRSAEIIVRAEDREARVLPASRWSSRDGTRGGEFSRSFHLTPVTGADLTHADVWLADAAVLRSAELVSLEYRNGTRWHRDATSRCVAVPDLLVLTGSR